jgi:hypothetical protein
MASPSFVRLVALILFENYSSIMQKMAPRGSFCNHSRQHAPVPENRRLHQSAASGVGALRSTANAMSGLSNRV